MTEHICPICGAAPSASRAACPACGFPLAFVALFSDESARRFREAQIALFRQRRFEGAQHRFASALSMADRRLVLRRPGGRGLTVLTPGGESETLPDAVQFSRSRTHELVLRADGTVTARGSNSFGQCVVKDLRDVSFVLAGPNATYAVGRDGRVTVRGSCPFSEIVENWENVAALAAGDHHLVCLTKDGSVRFAGALNAPAVFRSACPWKNIAAIAAANDYALALDRDGNVFFAGYADDADRRPAAGWTNVAAIAAEDMYAAALTRDGKILLAGEGGFLDRGKSEAAKWTGAVAIAAASGGVGALTEDGTLLLAGDSFADAPERERLGKVWKQMLES